jgi:hypothetical protein
MRPPPVSAKSFSRCTVRVMFSGGRDNGWRGNRHWVSIPGSNTYHGRMIAGLDCGIAGFRVTFASENNM